jgi:hypothetical protein
MSQTVDAGDLVRLPASVFWGPVLCLSPVAFVLGLPVGKKIWPCLKMYLFALRRACARFGVSD